MVWWTSSSNAAKKHSRHSAAPVFGRRIAARAVLHRSQGFIFAVCWFCLCGSRRVTNDTAFWVFARGCETSFCVVSTGALPFLEADAISYPRRCFAMSSTKTAQGKMAQAWHFEFACEKWASKREEGLCLFVCLCCWFCFGDAGVCFLEGGQNKNTMRSHVGPHFL